MEDDMFIERHILGYIERMMQQFKIVLIVGPRQVGKTFLLKKSLLPEYGYSVLDDYNELEIAKRDPALFFKNHQLPVLVDEVQRAPELFLQMKLLVDESEKKGRIVITGSQSYRLLKNASDSLVGRVCIVDMASLSMREKLGISFNKEFVPEPGYLKARACKLKPYSSIWSEIHRGSLPELQNQDIEWEPYYRSYVRTYLDRDVADLINTSNLLKFNAFMRSLAARTGELFNADSIANDIGVSSHTIKEWTSILEASGLIILLRSYSSNLSNRVVKTPKVYFMDTGLVCYLVGWSSPAVAMNGAMSGALFETFVVSEVVKSYYNSGHDLSGLFFYRDKNMKEIDLVIEKDGIVYPVEIKKTARPTIGMAKGFSALASISGKPIGQGCIICQADRLFELGDNVSAVPVEYL